MVKISQMKRRNELAELAKGPKVKGYTNGESRLKRGPASRALAKTTIISTSDFKAPIIVGWYKK